MGRGAKAQAEGPKRLIAMFTHHGCITTRFFPETSHGALTAEDLESTTLHHLAPYADKLLLPRGMRAMNEWTTELLRGQGNDTYLQAAGSYFTCQPVTPNSDDPFSFSSETKFNAKPMGPSLDHVIAAQLSPDGAPLYLRAGGVNDSAASAVSYSAAETIYTGSGTLAEIFGRLTGLASAEGDMSPDSYQAVRGKSIVDLVQGDLETLERLDMSQSDRTKLEAWKALLDDTGRLLIPGTCDEGALDALQLTQANIDTAMASTIERDRLTTLVTDTLDGADIHSNVAVLAALCNANPMIVLKYPTNYVFSGLGITIDSSSLSHRGDNAGMQGPCVPNAIDLIQSIDDYYARKFAHLIGMLDSFDEGDGTLLDNSAAVWFQEVSDGCARNLNNLPVVQAGGMRGYFKTGWAVNVEDGSASLTRGNSEAQCTPDTTDQYNQLTQETGTDPTIANVPINKYYCTLMNALGVKAGEDGFPAVGGSAEVTKFGRYDRTEDFVGGDVNPPLISDPGELTALKAT